MIRVKLFGLLSACLLLAAPLGGQELRRVEEKKPEDKKADPHHGAFMDCAKACDDCARMCDACSGHCSLQIAAGKKEHLATLWTCRDCATLCRAAATITAHQGPYSDLACIACADACKRCGDSCEKFKDDEMMKKCADECRRCEKSCREMLKHTGAPK
jgi:hypothetical protein